jgi:hypothetical protein
MIDANSIPIAPVDAPLAKVIAANNPASQEWVSDLAAWKLLTDRSERLNRNLIQYAASIAAALGISTGSGGVFALAESVAQKPTIGWEHGLLSVFILAVTLVAAVTTVVLFGLLANAYRARERAEHEASEHLQALIAAKPEHFLSESK